MDEKVTAVLDTYHERLHREQEAMRSIKPANLGASIDQMLLAVGPETGQLINILAKSLTRPNILELGTSYGYSTIWLAAAARATNGRVTTMELQDYKATYARDMARKAGLETYIDFKVGDAVKMIDEVGSGFDFVLVDLWKDLYVPCLEAFYTKLNPAALVVADNMTFPGGPEVQHYRRAIRARPGITSVLLPVGSGLEVSRFQSEL